MYDRYSKHGNPHIGNQTQEIVVIVGVIYKYMIVSWFSPKNQKVSADELATLLIKY